MNRIYLFVTFVFLIQSCSTLSAEGKWEPSIKKGFEIAKSEKKFLIVDLYADWCTYCLVLEKEIFPDPEVAKVLDGFVRVRLDGDEFPNLKKKYNVEGYPTILFLDADANYLTKITGLATKEEILRVSNQILLEPSYESYLNTERRKTNDSPEILFRLGSFHQKENNIPKAKEFYSKVLSHPKANSNLKELTKLNLAQLESPAPK